MRSKPIAIIAMICFVSSLIWLIFMIWIAIDSGPLDTFSQVFRYVRHLNFKYYVSYINAALLTLCIAMLFSGLAKFLASINKLWAFAGFIFVPVYCTINLFVYLSQITVVPHLLKSTGFSAYSPAAYFLLTQFLHLWPDSAVSFFNSTAYAVLGIPSIVYGFLLGKINKGFRTAGILFILNGIACIIGMIGMLLKSLLLANGTSVGGVFFIAALVPLAAEFFKPPLTNEIKIFEDYNEK